MAFALAKNGFPSSFSASHGSVVCVLSEPIGKTVADKDRLEVDISFLVAEDFGGKDRDVMTSIGFAGNVEVLVRIFGELFEEESEERIDVLASCNCI